MAKGRKTNRMLINKNMQTYVLGLASVFAISLSGQVSAKSPMIPEPVLDEMVTTTEVLTSDVVSEHIHEPTVTEFVTETETVTEQTTEAISQPTVIEEPNVAPNADTNSSGLITETTGPIELSNTLFVSELLPNSNFSLDLKVSDLGKDKVVQPILKKEILDAKMAVSLLSQDTRIDDIIYYDKNLWRGKDSFYRLDATTGTITFDSSILLKQGLEVILRSDSLGENITLTFKVPEQNKERDLVQELPTDYPTYDLPEFPIEFEVPKDYPTYDLPEFPIEIQVPTDYPTYDLQEALIPVTITTLNEFSSLDSSDFFSRDFLTQAPSLLENSSTDSRNVTLLNASDEDGIVIDLSQLIKRSLLEEGSSLSFDAMMISTRITLTVKTKEGAVTRITPELNEKGEIIFRFPEVIDYVTMTYKTADYQKHEISIVKIDNQWESDASMITTTEDGNVVLDTNKLPKNITMTVVVQNESNKENSSKEELELGIFETPSEPKVTLLEDTVLIKPEENASKMVIKLVSKVSGDRKVEVSRSKDGNWSVKGNSLFVSKNNGSVFFTPEVLAELDSFTVYTMTDQQVKSFEMSARWNGESLSIKKESDKLKAPIKQLVIKDPNKKTSQ